MRMLFPEFTRIVKAMERMSSPPAELAPDYPGLANVLFAHPLGKEGTWAFYSNGSETLGLQAALLEPDMGRRLYARAGLVAAQLAMVEAAAVDADCVSLNENSITLHRAHPGRGQRNLEISVPDGQFCCIKSLPEACEQRTTIGPDSLAVMQRAAGLWDGPGGCLWLRSGEGVFTHSRGVSRREPCALDLPGPCLCFPIFAGILGLDSSRPVECFFTVTPGSKGVPSRCVGFQQPSAIYYSVQHASEEAEQFDLLSREKALGKIAADPQPWLKVPRRSDRRALIRVLTNMGGEGIRLFSDAQGRAQASNGITTPVDLPMVQVEGAGEINCRTVDLCRVLRQDFGCLELPGDKELAAIIFDRSLEGSLGAITVASRPA